MEDKGYFVHPSSYVDDHVTVGDGVANVATGSMKLWNVRAEERIHLTERV